MKKNIIYGILIASLALLFLVINLITNQKTEEKRYKINLEKTVDDKKIDSIKENINEYELEQTEIDKIQEAEGALIEEEYLSDNRKKFIDEAKKNLGVQAAILGNNPKTGFSNLGYIYYTLQKSGLDYQQQSIEILYNLSKPTDMRTIGDLIFFKDENGKYIHVAIYIGNNQMIHCTNKVEIEDINGYWIEHYDSYRKICI